MARQPKLPETQVTPKGKVIPVPKRSKFLGDLDKVIKALSPKKAPSGNRRIPRSG